MEYFISPEREAQLKQKAQQTNALFDRITEHIGKEHPSAQEAIDERDHGGGGAEEALLVYDEAVIKGEISIPEDMAEELEAVIKEFIAYRR